MALPPELENVRHRPGMYFRKVEFDVVAALIAGIDSAKNGGLLIGFREWLITRLGYGNNWPWEGLVWQLTFPGRVAGEQMAPEDHKRAVESLFGILDEFLEEKYSPEGLRRIFAKYERWLSRQDWYDPSSPLWIDES